jgi:hypothetical protein
MVRSLRHSAVPVLASFALVIFLAPVCSGQSGPGASPQTSPEVKLRKWGHPILFVGAEHATLLKPAAKVEMWIPSQRSQKDIIMSVARGFGGYQVTAGIGVDAGDDDLLHFDLRGVATRAAGKTWVGIEATPLMIRVANRVWLRSGAGLSFNIGSAPSRGRVTGNVGVLVRLN